MTVEIDIPTKTDVIQNFQCLQFNHELLKCQCICEPPI